MTGGMGPGPPGWGLGVGSTTPTRKKLPIKKPEMWPRTKGLEEVHYGGEDLHWAVMLIPNLTAFITGHGKTKAYLHYFGILKDPTCCCLQKTQTVDHLIFSCTILRE